MKFKRIVFFTIVFFILVVFFFALKKPNIYNTKNLIGQKIEPFEIISFENNEIVTEKKSARKQLHFDKFLGLMVLTL